MNTPNLMDFPANIRPLRSRVNELKKKGKKKG